MQHAQSGFDITNGTSQAAQVSDRAVGLPPMSANNKPAHETVQTPFERQCRLRPLDGVVVCLEP